MDLPTEYLFLDGYSLSTDDLLQLGKNRYKIKVIEIYKYFLLIETIFLIFYDKWNKLVFKYRFDLVVDQRLGGKSIEVKRANR